MATSIAMIKRSNSDPTSRRIPSIQHACKPLGFCEQSKSDLPQCMCSSSLKPLYAVRKDGVCYCIPSSVFIPSAVNNPGTDTSLLCWVDRDRVDKNIEVFVNPEIVEHNPGKYSSHDIPWCVELFSSKMI